jgi:hypothetical protein
MIKFILLALTFALVAALPLGAWLVATPAGPIVAAVAIVAQAQRQPQPAYAVAGLVTMSDRAFLFDLLTREV